MDVIVRRSIKFWCVIFALWLPISVGKISAQSVGLVLSGGAARGITHIGVIKALEENDIPIDYVVGTSMGAIVGGLYSIGFSPDEMIQLIKSEDFKRWQTGEISADDEYFYNKLDAKPSILTLSIDKSKNRPKRFDLKGLVPSYIVPTHQMNLAFLELFAPATKACNKNFDSLMVPFRCTASNIFTKEALNCKSGDVGDAVRASMSFPFMFKPVEVDGQLLYDGGIYNSFPKNIMIDDFNPDYLIGSVTAIAKKYENSDDFKSQMMNLVLKNTDYTLEGGTLLNFNLDGYASWDFAEVDNLVKLGYDSTMAHIESIKQHVKRHVTPEQMAAKRAAFKSRCTDLHFKNIFALGVDSLQYKFIESHFGETKAKRTAHDLRTGYFMLLGSGSVSEISPHAYYNKEQQAYDLYIKLTPRKEIEVNLGGNLSTYSSNQTYLGFSYNRFQKFSSSAWVDTHLGLSYVGINMGYRINMPKRWMYINPQLVRHNFYFFYDNPTSNLNKLKRDLYQNEFYGKLAVGFPLMGLRGKIEFGVGAGRLNDYFNQINDSISDIVEDYDRSSYWLSKAFVKGEYSTLNAQFFPDAGSYFKAMVNVVGGRSEHEFVGRVKVKESSSWVQAMVDFDKYQKFTKHFALGVRANLRYSTRKLQPFFVASLTQSSRFTPVPYSLANYDYSYCTDRYLAAGLVPIININERWQIRLESYAYLPYRTIERAEDNMAMYSSSTFPDVYAISQATLVRKLRFASISAFATHYYTNESAWYFGLNFGLFLSKDRFLE